LLAIAHNVLLAIAHTVLLVAFDARPEVAARSSVLSYGSRGGSRKCKLCDDLIGTRLLAILLVDS
jgi:hypothetical protein